MAVLRGLEPISGAGARLLVLGSMPGQRSLAEGRYYAHPRNAFWPILGRCLGFDPDVPDAERVAALAAAGIALWDVLGACRRAGSADAAIEPGTERANDIAGFLASRPGIARICFNGAAAERLFCRLVLPGLPDADRLDLHRLPSTSPAHAAMDFEAKLAAWRAGLAPLIDSSR